MNTAFVRFCVGLFAWESVVFMPITLMFLHAGRQPQSDDVIFLGPIVLLGILVTAICWLFARKFSGTAAIILGTLSGIVLAVLGGVFWAHFTRGFEAFAATSTGGLDANHP